MLTMDFFLLAVAAVTLIVLGYPLKWWKKMFETEWAPMKKPKKIPGYLPLPFVGTVWAFVHYGYTPEKIQEYYRDMFAQFGNIFKEEGLFNYRIINVVDRSDIEKVFKSDGKFPQRPPTEVIAYYRKSRPDRYLTVGMVNEQGEIWHFLRSKLAGGLISPSTIAKEIPNMEVIADDWCYYLKQICDDKGRIDGFENLMCDLALEATCSLILGRRMGFLLPGSESKLTKRFGLAVREVFKACRDTHFGLPFWKIFPTDAYKRLIAGEEEIYDITLELIRNADDCVKESEIFQSVIRADVDEREKIAALVDYISAGIFTLSNSFTFLLHFIASHQHIQDKLYADVSESSLTYAKACVKESFRILPTANPIARVLNDDIELSGHVIKKGTTVLCHTGRACRDDNNFYQADEFIPERWLENDKGTKQSASTFLVVPFGVGKRVCPGKRFIELVMPIVLAQLVKKFKITTDMPLEVQFEFLFSPKGPVSMTFTDR